MKKLISAVILLWLLSNTNGHATPASYLDSDPAARPSGMGSAFTGLADDENAPLFNPAGLANMDMAQFEASASVGFLTQDRLQNYLGASQQLPPHSYLGFDILQYGVNNIDGRDINGLPTSNLQDLEMAFGCTYAYEVNYYFKAGISANFIYQNLAGTNARGFGGADIGILFVPTALYDFTVGACVHHLGGFLTWDTGTNEYLGPDLRVGLSQKLFTKTLVLAYDAEWQMNSTFNIIHHAGIEWWVQKFLAFRGGWDQNNPTGGLSIKIQNYSLDYSYEFESDGLGDTQRVTLNMVI